MTADKTRLGLIGRHGQGIWSSRSASAGARVDEQQLLPIGIADPLCTHWDWGDRTRYVQGFNVKATSGIARNAPRAINSVG